MGIDLVDLFGEELAEQVEDRLGDKYLVVEEENHVPKSSFNEERDKLKNKVEVLEEKIQAKEEQIEQRDQQLEQLKEDTQATEELQQKVNEFEEINNNLKEEKEELVSQKEQEIKQTLAKERKARAIEVALANKATHPDLLMAKVDFDSLEFDDDTGEVKGVDDVVSNLQENYDDLFIEETLEGRDDSGGGKNVKTKDPSEMTDQEYIKARESGELEI